VKFEGRANLGYDKGNFSADIFINYLGGYTYWGASAVNPIVRTGGVPTGGGDKVKAFTVDLHAAYTFKNLPAMREAAVYVECQQPAQHRAALRQRLRHQWRGGLRRVECQPAGPCGQRGPAVQILSSPSGCPARFMGRAALYWRFFPTMATPATVINRWGSDEGGFWQADRPRHLGKPHAMDA
jgi:hypothetical protein